MRAEYLLAWLVPIVVGGGFCWLAGARQRRGGEVASAIGMGWIGGVFIAAFALHRFGRADTVHALAHAWPWLAALGALGWVSGIAGGLRARSPGTDRALPERSAWARVLWWVLLALILTRLLLLADEASLRPLFPWDAWSAWAVKPKTWMLLGHAEPYVSISRWLANPVAPTRSMATWNYPELLPWLQVWFASGAGGWNEPLVNLAWCGALAAFALAAYGYWRNLGLRPSLAIALVYLLVSLPLIDAHVALAGYADLWVAVTLGLATLAWTRWMLHRERGQWLLAVAFALCLPAIKHEGAIWLLAFSVVVALDLLPSHWRRIVAAAIVLLIVAGLLLGGFVLPMLGLGWVHVAWGSVSIPTIGRFDLAWHPVGGAMLASLFTLPNWHLLWYLLPLLVALRWRALVRDHVARMLCLFLLLQLAFLFVLFFFTDAAAWANDFTSANRLILQIVPCVFVFAAVLLRDGGAARAFRSRASGISRGLLRPISPA